MLSWDEIEATMKSELMYVLLEIESPFSLIELLAVTKNRLVERQHHSESLEQLDLTDPDLQACVYERLLEFGCTQVRRSDESLASSEWLTPQAATAADRRHVSTRLDALEARVAALEARFLEREVSKLDGDMDPSRYHQMNRAVVVLARDLYSLSDSLRDRNLIVIDAKVDDFDLETRSWLLPFRAVIVTDERPFVSDASAYSYGIISVRMLSRREPAHLAKVISDAFAERSLWNRRHGYLLMLRDDGEHEYRLLVD